MILSSENCPFLFEKRSGGATYHHRQSVFDQPAAQKLQKYLNSVDGKTAFLREINWANLNSLTAEERAAALGRVVCRWPVQPQVVISKHEWYERKKEFSVDFNGYGAGPAFADSFQKNGILTKRSLQ